jgi:HlyD family secretion protein
MVDIARPPSVARKKKIRRAASITAAAVVVILITIGVSQLKPAAPSVERSTIWIETVKRGDFTRQVRGAGTLVPEEIMWISATTSGRVQRILLRPGAQVAPDTVILELTNPDLE